MEPFPEVCRISVFLKWIWRQFFYFYLATLCVRDFGGCCGCSQFDRGLVEQWV